jgi:hypothetical protein
MKVKLSIEFTVVGEADQPVPHLEDHLDDVQDELMVLDGIEDAVISATLSKGDVEVSLIAEGEDELDAYSKAIAGVRTAIHAAGGFTHWAVHSSHVLGDDAAEDDLLPA